MRTTLFMLILVLSSFIIFQGCQHDGCEPEETKCDGDLVMVCNSEKDWEREADCSEVEDFGAETNWICCADPEDGIHACLPAVVCADGGS